MKKVFLGLLGGGVIVMGGALWAGADAYGEHITACGIDAKGPYADVRVVSLNGLGGHQSRQVFVRFSYDNRVSGRGSTFIRVDSLVTHGRVHGRHWRAAKNKVIPTDPAKMQCAVGAPLND